jgi:hypothetical protein
MSAAPITETGVRGFLKWFKREQPALYSKIAPLLPKKVPAAFSNYEAGGYRVAGLSRDDAVTKLNKIYKDSFSRRAGLGRFADYDPYASMTGSNPNAYFSSGITTNYTAQLSTMPSYTASYSSTPTANIPVDTSTAANNGPSPTSTTNGIANVINAASGLVLSGAAAVTQAQIVSAQLARAASGLSPLNTSLNANGVPTVVSSSTTTVLLLGGLALAALLVVSGGSSSKKKAA